MLAIFAATDPQHFTCLTAFHANLLCNMNMVVQACPLHSLLLRQALSPLISKGYCDDCEYFMDASLCGVGAGPRRNLRQRTAPELFKPDWDKKTREPSVRVQQKPSKKNQKKKHAGTDLDIEAFPPEMEAFLPVRQRETHAIMPAEELSLMPSVIVTGTPPQPPRPAPVLPDRFTG